MPNLYFIVGFLVLAFGLGAGTGAKLTALSKNKEISELIHQQDETNTTLAQNVEEQRQKQQAAQAVLTQKISDLDHKGFEANAQIQQITRDRTDAVAAGTRKLSVAAHCGHPVRVDGVPKSTAAAGVDNGAGARAELDPAAGRALYAIAGTGDSAIVRLNACIQQYEALRVALDTASKP